MGINHIFKHCSLTYQKSRFVVGVEKLKKKMDLLYPPSTPPLPSKYGELGFVSFQK